MACIGNDIVDVNFASTGQTGGMQINKYVLSAFKFTPTSKCLSFLHLVKIKKYNNNDDLKIDIRKNWTGYNIPENSPLATFTKKNDELSTSFNDMTIDINLVLPEANTPYWLTLYSSGHSCCNTTDIEGCNLSVICDITDFEVTYSGTYPKDSFMRLNYACKNGVFRNCQWVPWNGILAFATYKKTYAEPPLCTFKVT